MEDIISLLSETKNEPRPLLCGNKKFGIIWSAKSACTKVISWYFKINGLLAAAQFYHQWPHFFREEVLYNSKVYIRWINSVSEDYSWYQFMRDPVRRSLSAYRHNVLYGYADQLIAAAIQRDIDPNIGYSLNEFIIYLRKANVNGQCDIHIKSQWHPLSGRAEVINIDETDMYSKMNTIEAKHNLSQTDFARHPIFSSIDATHNAKLSEVVQEIDPDRPFSRFQAAKKWPVTVDTIPREKVNELSAIYDRDYQLISLRLASGL